MKKQIIVAVLGLSVITALAQVGIDRAVNAYSLITNTWASFTATTITAGTLTANTLAIGGTGSGTLTGIVSTNVSVDFGACGTNATVTVTKTITGIDTNDVPILQYVSPHTSFVYNISVTAADTVTISASNISITNAINQAASDARITVLKY